MRGRLTPALTYRLTTAGHSRAEQPGRQAGRGGKEGGRPATHVGDAKCDAPVQQREAGGAEVGVCLKRGGRGGRGQRWKAGRAGGAWQLTQLAQNQHTTDTTNRWASHTSRTRPTAAGRCRPAAQEEDEEARAAPRRESARSGQAGRAQCSRVHSRMRPVQPALGLTQSRPGTRRAALMRSALRRTPWPGLCGRRGRWGRACRRARPPTGARSCRPRGRSRPAPAAPS